MKSLVLLYLSLPLFLLSSCKKSHDVRFVNYSTERMDSVIIGNQTLVFTNIERLAQSGYVGIKKGDYAVTCISESKKRYSSSVTIPNNDRSRRSIQIDGTGAISILED